jgi:hypothetical protein
VPADIYALCKKATAGDRATMDRLRKLAEGSRSEPPLIEQKPDLQLMTEAERNAAIAAIKAKYGVPSLQPEPEPQPKEKLEPSSPNMSVEEMLKWIEQNASPEERAKAQAKSDDLRGKAQ